MMSYVDEDVGEQVEAWRARTTAAAAVVVPLQEDGSFGLSVHETQVDVTLDADETCWTTAIPGTCDDGDLKTDNEERCASSNDPRVWKKCGSASFQAPATSLQGARQEQARQRRLDELIITTVQASFDQSLPQPAEKVSRPDPGKLRPAAYLSRMSVTFNKKALKRNVLKVVEHSHLKLGTLASSDIQLLHMSVRVVVITGLVIQILFGVAGPHVQQDADNESNQDDLGGNGVWTDASIQFTMLLVSSLYIRRILLCSRRQRIQVEILRLAGLAWVFASLSLASNAWNALHPTSSISRELMGATNTLMAALVYFLLTHLSDFYLNLVAGWAVIEHPVSDPGEQQVSTWRWIRYISGKRFSQVIPVLILVYMALRFALGWRNSVVFDFLPMTNVITPARLIRVHGMAIQQPYLLVDSIVISTYDAALLAIAFYKSSCAHRSFQHIFVEDFARIFTEFHVFVLYFRDTVLYITIGGHIAAWLAPFNRDFRAEDHDDSEERAIRVVQLGAVQLQLGFLFSVAVWLITVMFCALPDDSVGLKGWFAGTNTIKHKHQQIKYFLYESDVHLKTKFANLLDIDQIDPAHFIMTRQIGAFNLAQLVYACGKHESTFLDPQSEIAHVQTLVGDSDFSVVEIIHDVATDTHCLILESSTWIAVAFRGTSSKKNAKTDLNAAMSLHLTAKHLDFSKVPSLAARSLRGKNAELPVINSTRTWLHRLLCKRNPPKVHSGFYAAYLSVEKRVLARVKQLHDLEPRKILTTGHSLGGALAVLCSFSLVVQLKIANVTCTTFGCPRVGNTAFKKMYNRAVPATFAFVNSSDVVTKLPPKTPKALSYTSVGTVVLVNSFGNLVIDPNVLELAVLHKGYSAKAHLLRGYQLSLLLWCLRSHKMLFLPTFWKPAREFLGANSSHLPEILEYLKALPPIGAADGRALGRTSSLERVAAVANHDAGDNTRS